MATQLANPGALNERVEEIQREIYSSQQQLHIYEERLRSATSHQRLFEPDPAAFGSTSEIDCCEKNYLLGVHMTPFDPAASGMEGTDGAQMHTDQAEGMGTFAGDAALWAAAGVGSDDPGHQMFGAADPLMYLRDQDVYDATSQVTRLHGDPCAGGGGEAADAEAEAEAWLQAYTCTELLSTPFPLMPHCLGPDDEFLPLQDSSMAAAQEPVETSASCSYVPSDDAGDGLRQHRGARERRLT
ncbi:hypothetical protein PVAP13_6NG269632 [Panicum virgatum]|uniref:Uncharacterized protein n=1 Tax=Panicum virgatum TaxID=38727 RepID=A0A8T0R348_PANVG|nr:hypothetical protein PVAP13_6NG269632 [Panicum virgatum]